MTLYPYIDGEQAVEITESRRYKELTAQAEAHLDGLDIQPDVREELQAILTGKELEAARLAFRYGVKAGDLHAHLVGRLQQRD